MLNEGELILQPGGKRFASNYAGSREMCATCGATVFGQTAFGHFENGVFVIDYFDYRCIECKTPRPIEYVIKKEEKPKK